MKHSPLGRYGLALTLSLPLLCLTATAGERLPAANGTIQETGKAGPSPASGPADEDGQPSLEEADAVLHAALRSQDRRRIAEALTLRARVLEQLGRLGEATAGWADAARGWAAAGDAEREVGALIGGSLTSRDRIETRRLIERALDLATSLPQPAPAMLETLNRGGSTLEDRGDLPPARRLFEGVLDLHRRIRPDSIEVAANLDRIGNLASRTGNLSEAETFHRQALELWERIAPVSGDRAQCLSLLCLLERKLGKIPEAIQLGREAADIYAQTFNGSPQHLAALRNLALAVIESGDLESGQRRLLRVLSLATGPDFEEERIQCLDALGALAERRRDPQDALAYFSASLALLEKSAPESAHTANVQRAVARSLGFLGREREAHAAYARTLEVSEKLMPGTMPVAHTLREMGELAHRSKDREGARVYYSRALEIVRRHPPAAYDLGVLLSRLGAIAFEEREYLRCDTYLAEAEELFLRRFPESHDLASVWIMQGWLAERVGQLERAGERYGRAREIIRVSGSDPNNVSQLEQAQGVLASRRGDLNAAIRHFRAALALRERFNPDPLGLGIELANLGGVHLQQKRYAEATQWFGRAWKLIRNELGSIADAQTLGVVGADRQWIAGGLAECYARQQKPLDALLVVEQARARSLAALLSDQRSVDATLPKDVAQLLARAQAERDRAQSDLAQRSQELLRAEARLARDPGDENLRGEVARIESAFERARQEFGVQRAAVSRLNAGAGLKRPEFTGSNHSSAEVSAAVSRLPAGTLYLAYQATASGMLLVAVDGTQPRNASGTAPSRVSVFTIDRPEPILAQQVDRYLEAMVAASGEAVSLGREISGMIFPPGIRASLGRARRCVISPDGPLWGLPFAALPLPAGVKEPGFLGLSRSLTTASSLSLFVRSSAAPSRTPGRRPEVLAVGDPVFDRSIPPQERLALAGDRRAFLFADGQPPQPLPGTREDATVVARAYGSTPLLGEEATEAAVRKRLPLADVVHLATHGYLNPRWALASGVLLTEPPHMGKPGRAKAKALEPGGMPEGTRSAVAEGVIKSETVDPSDNGALQAWEILSQLKLRADLVVLAACETGKGEFMRGEGLQGLTRSLHVAGARSVVASLWKVRDDSTRQLMERMHRGVLAGLPKDEALRRAMVEVSRRKGWEHPFYWAGFVLTGDRENRLFAGTAPASGAGPAGTGKPPAKPRTAPVKPAPRPAKSPR